VAAITTIVVPDAAGTPVNHTFAPAKVDGDTATWLEKSNTSSLGYWTLSITQRAPLAGQTSKVYRTKLSFQKPTVVNEVINGVTRPSIAYVNGATVEFVLPADASLQERKDHRKLLVGILNDASFIDLVENQNNAY